MRIYYGAEWRTYRLPPGRGIHKLQAVNFASIAGWYSDLIRVTPLIDWLSSRENPPVRYLVARDLADGTSERSLGALRRDLRAWPPLGRLLALQGEDGGGETWVEEAAAAVEERADSGRIPMVRLHPTKVLDPLPFEEAGHPSRFLTLQWLRVRKKLGLG